MRQPAALRFALAVVFAGLVASVVSCFGPDQTVVWFCLNPVTGKDGDAPYDQNHYVGGVFDPCHCYDPCGPEKSCPIVVDAGPASLGCDAGAPSDGGP